MARKSNRRFTYPFAFLALVLALIVVENLSGDAKADAAIGQIADVQAASVEAADLADLPLMYE